MSATVIEVNNNGSTVVEIAAPQGPQGSRGPQGPGPDFVDANITTTGTLLAGAGSVITGNSSTPALRVTQEGSGNALLIEDDVHPDNTPLVINNVGQIISGATTPISPTAGLQLTADSASAPNSGLLLRMNSDSANTAISLQRARGTLANTQAVQNGDRIAGIGWVGHDGASIVGSSVIRGEVDGTVSSGVVPGRITISTFNASGVEGERMRITSAGNVGIGTTANAAAILDVASTTKGFLPPRMTEVERDAITTPPAGLMVYNSTTNKLNFYNGTAWEAVTSS
jgi:hypothetical protein